jgi:hypothetical protein
MGRRELTVDGKSRMGQRSVVELLAKCEGAWLEVRWRRGQAVVVGGVACLQCRVWCSVVSALPRIVLTACSNTRRVLLKQIIFGEGLERELSDMLCVGCCRALEREEGRRSGGHCNGVGVR